MAALIRSTETLRGKARARALAKGMEGTYFVAEGSIREIVVELIPSLVGNDAASALAWTALRLVDRLPSPRFCREQESSEMIERTSIRDYVHR